MPRSPDLQLFLTSAETAIRQGCGVDERLRLAADRMFSALQTPCTQVKQPETARLPVCSYLPTALEHARRQPGPVGVLADVFTIIEPELHWKVRDGADALDEQFRSGHANAEIVGLEGLEMRHDVRIGVSLMAPHRRYPDHRHPPEEIYVVLSDGEWRQEGNPWHERGSGDLVYNPPNIVHAMRSAERPLLAVWFLWTGQGNT